MVNVRTEGQKSVLATPASPDSQQLGFRTDLWTFHKEHAIEIEHAGKAEITFMRMWEDYYREIHAEDPPEIRHEMCWTRPNNFKKSHSMEEYIVWLQENSQGVRADSGLTHQRKAPPMSPVPAEAMRVEVRRDLDLWQIAPDEAGVVQVAEIPVQAIHDKAMVVMLIDLDPFSRLAFGGGKSQLLFQILYWAYKLLDPPRVFDPRKDIVYRQDRARLARMFHDEDQVPWGVDEVNKFFDKWNWASKDDKGNTHQLEMYRKVGRPIVGACPSIWLMNERMRETIITHRLMITKWDKHAFMGEATLFEKYGPPKFQDEGDNKWGAELFRIKFHGVAETDFQILNACPNMLDKIEGDMGLDEWLTKHPDWPDWYHPEESIEDIATSISRMAGSPLSAGSPAGTSEHLGARNHETDPSRKS